MKLTTLRNLMASLLVLGVAGSVIAVGTGTFALFNATTTNGSNTFTTDDLTFTNTPNGGTPCTATASTTPSASCNLLVTVTNMVPGDSKLGLLTLHNGSAQVQENVSLAVTASPSTVLDTTAAINGTNPTASGLGLLIFRCMDSGEAAPQACSSASTKLKPLYGSCTPSDPSIAAGGVVPATFRSASTSDNTIAAGDGGASTCIAGNTATAISSVSLSAATLGLSTLSDNSKGLLVGDTDNLAVVVYLPGITGDTLAAKGPSTLSFAWTANQVVGGPR